MRDEISVVTPVRPRPGVGARAAYEAALARLEGIVGDPGSAARSPRRHAPIRCSPRRAGLEHAPKRDFLGDGRARQGLYPRRRYFSGRAVAALLGAVRSAGLRALSRAAPRQSGAVSLLPRFRRLPDRLLEPGNSGARARRQGHHPPDRRHPLARRGEGRGRALAAELLADEKERAEHLMLLDLGRNDVGRVAKIGTVKVTDRFAIERYSHVMHIVSNVEGELDAASTTASTRLAAGFPAGTVSGAPKVRAMEIIDELEIDKRGIYGGCIGYFGSGGDGHLHRAAHLDHQGRPDACAGGRRHRLRQRTGV